MDDIIFFGETNFRNQKRRFGMKANDRRRHMYVIGKTGMGKTTLLENMAIQDIRSGKGVGIIDPHGEFAEKMLDFIPQDRIQDVIYFNPADTRYPIAFNSMESVLPEQRHLVAAGLLGVFKKIFGPDVWSARMEYLLSNAILALLEIPGSTLLGINRMFADKEFRRSVVAQLADPVVRAFWEKEYAQYQERFATEASAAIQNKVGQFISNPLIRNIIGQEKSSMDMRDVMDSGKIFIMNLAKGRIGEENARLLGAMLVTKLYLSAMTRVDMPEEARRDFYLYVDEFQNFATESFASILSEARKYRLNLILAHQYVSQMDEKVEEAVFGNVGTLLSFRIGAQDAELLEKEFSPEFLVSDLVNLAFAQIYLRLMIDGVASRPFSASTIPPLQRPGETYREEIIEYSRKNYGVNAEEIERKIEEFHGLSGVASSETEIPLSSSRRGEERMPARKLYDATCAVDGEAIKVPFMPDGRRLVYCEKHLEMMRRGELPEPLRRVSHRGGAPRESMRLPPRQASADARRHREFRAADVGERSRHRGPTTPLAGRPVVHSSEGKQPLSLDALRPQEEKEREAEGSPEAEKNALHTRSSRHAISRGGEKKEINISELRKILSESLDRHERRKSSEEMSGEKETGAFHQEIQKGTMKPGETVRFD